MTSAARPETGTSASLVSEQLGALLHLSGGVKPQWCWPPALLALCPAASPAQTSRSFLAQETLTLCVPLQPRSTSPCGSGTPEPAALATGQCWLLCRARGAGGLHCRAKPRPWLRRTPPRLPHSGDRGLKRPTAPGPGEKGTCSTSASPKQRHLLPLTFLCHYHAVTAPQSREMPPQQPGPTASFS